MNRFLRNSRIFLFFLCLGMSIIYSACTKETFTETKENILINPLIETFDFNINNKKEYNFTWNNIDLIDALAPCIPHDWERSFTYRGCCTTFTGYSQPPIPNQPASLLFSKKRYEPYNSNDDIRFYLKVKIDNIVKHENYWVDFEGYCGNYGLGFVLDLGICPGQGEVIYALGVLHSSGVFEECTSGTGTFYYPGHPDLCSPD